MSELVEFLNLSNLLELCLDQFPYWLCWLGGINKDPTVWLDGTRPPPKYAIKNNMGSMNTKIWPTETLIETLITDQTGVSIHFQSFITKSFVTSASFVFALAINTNLRGKRKKYSFSMKAANLNGTGTLKKCKQSFEYQQLLLLRDIWW